MEARAAEEEAEEVGAGEEDEEEEEVSVGLEQGGKTTTTGEVADRAAALADGDDEDDEATATEVDEAEEAEEAGAGPEGPVGELFPLASPFPPPPSVLFPRSLSRITVQPAPGEGMPLDGGGSSRDTRFCAAGRAPRDGDRHVRGACAPPAALGELGASVLLLPRF